MGLDICFNKAKALKAGLVIIEDTHGTPEDIAEARRSDSGSDSDLAYLQWLQRITTFTKVPGTEYMVHVDVCGNSISIRANKWGSTYGPLISWLQKHDISWREA